tara:strand:+ start:5625 stop:6662 length:1038 start_codon:yes stop_codon:yes gene_type:complete
MDDFNLSSLIESKNEWSARLLNIITPSIIEGVTSIFQEADNLCIENSENSKYLMTFQNLLNNVPKWTHEIVNNEKNRIIESTNCPYLEDLLTCVHIIQLKSLTCARVSSQQKKLDIEVPNINQFIHRLYINVARKVYVNVYLFEKDIPPLQIQKHNRELELIVREAILSSVRESIPIENILKAYIDETQETDVVVEEKQEVVIDEKRLKLQEDEERRLELEKIKQDVKHELELQNSNKVSTIMENVNKDLNKTTSETTTSETTTSITDDITAKDMLNIDTNLEKQLDKELEKTILGDTNFKILDNDGGLNNDIEIDTIDINSTNDKDVFTSKLDDDNIELEIEDL